MHNNNYICKTVSEIMPGEIILHPIYRKDKLLLIERYKRLLPDYINKIRQQLPSYYWIIIAKDEEAFDQFIKNKEYKDFAFNEILLKLVDQYSDKIQVPFTIDDFKDEDINIEITKGKILTVSKNNDEDYFKRTLLKNPLFSSFENYIDSSYAKIRAAQIRSKLLETLSKNEELKKYYIKMKLYDEIMFIHSVNATSIALLVGLCLELSDEQLIDLSIASLFSDLGFISLPKNKFKLYLTNNNENEIYLQQLESFKKLALESNFLSKNSIINAISDRHENFDGTGFPYHKKGDEINLLSRIIYFCQEYDKLAGGYGGKLFTPIESVQKLWEDIDIKYDSEIIKIFIYKTNLLRIGKTVYLDDGKKAMIIGFDDYIRQPIIPILKIYD